PAAEDQPSAPRTRARRSAARPAAAATTPDVPAAEAVPAPPRVRRTRAARTVATGQEAAAIGAAETANQSPSAAETPAVQDGAHLASGPQDEPAPRGRPETAGERPAQPYGADPRSERDPGNAPHQQQGYSRHQPPRHSGQPRQGVPTRGSMPYRPGGR